MTEELKPHQIAQLVNKLRDIATKYHAHGCLRELISREVNAALTQRPAAQATPEPLGEPFGYFRALPFGWEQCGEHDDGAVALYTRPAPDGWTEADADAARLAMELECLLLDTKDTAAVSRWWKSANEAIDLHRARLAAAQAKGGE